MRYAAPLTDSAKSTACPSSSPVRTRARAILNTKPCRTAPATRQAESGHDRLLPTCHDPKNCSADCCGKDTRSSGASTFPPERRIRSGSPGLKPWTWTTPKTTSCPGRYYYVILLDHSRKQNMNNKMYYKSVWHHSTYRL